MRHAADTDECLKVLGDELWPIVADNTGCFSGKLLSGSLDNRLNLPSYRLEEAKKKQPKSAAPKHVFGVN